MRSGTYVSLLVVALVGFLVGLWSCSARRHDFSKERIHDVLREGRVVTKVEKMPGCDTRVGEVIGVVDAPRERVWEVISDYNEQKHFMPNLLESFLIRPEALEIVKKGSARDLRRMEEQLRQYRTDEVDQREVYVYSVGDFPWPMSDRGYILKIARDPQGYTAHATMVVGEMKVNEDFWELEPYGGDASKTLVKYRVLLDAGVAVPGFAVKMALNSTLPEVIEALRRRVKDSRYEHRAAGEAE